MTEVLAENFLTHQNSNIMNPSRVFKVIFINSSDYWENLCGNSPEDFQIFAKKTWVRNFFSEVFGSRIFFSHLFEIIARIEDIEITKAKLFCCKITSLQGNEKSVTWIMNDVLLFSLMPAAEYDELMKFHFHRLFLPSIQPTSASPFSFVFVYRAKEMLRFVFEAALRVFRRKKFSSRRSQNVWEMKLNSYEDKDFLQKYRESHSNPSIPCG